MTGTLIPADALEALRTSFLGSIVGPEDSGYDEARRVHNGFVDRRPALIARCRGTADVVDALAFARIHGLTVAVRGGGHNVAGRCIADDALVVDLSLMKGIHVDPAARTARAQGGVTWGEINKETHLHGLATTGGVISTTGIAGLTLGGGLGWLMGKYGMTVDNLTAAEVVLADGRVVATSETREPDLFWALRGGGGNFGAVTSFEYRLHPVETVTGGLVAHPFENARAVLRFYRDLTSDLPDEVCVFAGLVHAPDGSGVKLAALIACDCRPPGTDDRVTRAIKEFGSPVMDVLGPMPYPAVNSMLDAGFPKGALNYWKSSFLEDLTDEGIDTMIEWFARAPSPMCGLLLEHFHGAVTRVPGDATAYGHRRAGYNLLVAAEWVDPASSDACVAWARQSYSALEAHRAGARYVNYMGDDETSDQVAAAYGPNLPRLQALKAVYDPENVFHLNHNIPPAAEGRPA